MQFAVVQVLYRTNIEQFKLSILFPVEPYDYLKSLQNYYNRHFGLLRTDMHGGGIILYILERIAATFE